MKNLSLISIISTSLLFFNLSIGFSQSEYMKQTLFSLNWGNGIGEIGYLDNLSGSEGEGIHEGPSAFDVDKDGRIIILDSVNNYIKILNQKGVVLLNISIEDSGANFGYISLDEEGDIWHHNIFTRSFNKYDRNSGRLLKRVFYEETKSMSPDFIVLSDKIFGIGKKIINEELLPELGKDGEPIFKANIQNIEMNDPQISKGNFSNRKYIGLASKLDNNNLTKPSILIKEKDGSEFKLIFDEMSPLYDVFFVKEDKYGNSYFVFYYDDSLKPLQIHKYSPELKIVEKIVNLPYLPIHNGFPTIKPYIIDDYGNIYFMDLNKDGINILKWSHLQN